MSNPSLSIRDNMIIAGHGRVAAAQQIGYSTVPVLRIDHLDEAAKGALCACRQSLGRTGRLGPRTLSIELQGLIDIGYDVELTGFCDRRDRPHAGRGRGGVLGSLGAGGRFPIYVAEQP